VKESRELSLSEARKLAEKWLILLGECCCRKVDVVAGVYKGKDPTSDVDLIGLCDLKSLRRLSPVKEDRVRIVYNDNGAKIEVWKAEDEMAYELKKWYRRLDRKQFIELASKAKAKGMKLSWQRGLLKDDKLVTVNHEEIGEILS